MFLRHVAVSALSLVVFAGASLVAQAQTGPGGAGQKGGPKQGAGQKLTAERVAALLKSQVQTLPNGDKSVQAVIERDGWKYDVTIMFLAGGKVWDIYSPLSGPNQNFTPAQLQGQQQKNKEWEAQQKYFVVNPQDKRLYLADINFRTDCSEQEFSQALNSFMTTIRSTHDLWKGQ